MSENSERIHEFSISSDTGIARVYSPHFVHPEDANELVMEVIDDDSIDEDDDEELWDKAFAESADKLAKFADEALAELQEGRTQPLDPDKI